MNARRYDVFGNSWGRPAVQAQQVSGMLVPVLCAYCRELYDLCGVETTARYADCTVYNTPCCGRSVDDRPWLTPPAFERIDKARLFGSVPEREATP